MSTRKKTPVRKTTTRKAVGPELDAPEGQTMSIPAFMTAGRSGLKVSAGRLDEEFLQDLRDQKKDAIYREMFDNSPVIGGSFLLIESLLRQVTWKFDRAEDRETSDELIDFYQSCLEDMDDSWSSFISETREMGVHGFLPVEMLFKVRRGYNPGVPTLNSRHNDGRIGWRNFATRAPDSREEWLFDDEYNVIGMVQQVETDPVRRIIPADKMIIFRIRDRKHSPEGISLLRSAYFPYFQWKRLQEIEAIGIERNVAGYPVFTAPIEAFDPSSPLHARLTELFQVAKQVRQNHLWGLVIPAAKQQGMETGWGFELAASAGTNKAETDPVIQRYRSDQAVALLTEFLLLGQQGVGSFSLASDQSSMLTMALGAWLDAITEPINRIAVPMLGRLNGFDERQLPVLTHSDIEKIDLSKFATAITGLITAGALGVTDADEDALRTMFELPKRTEPRPAPTEDVPPDAESGPFG